MRGHAARVLRCGWAAAGGQHFSWAFTSTTFTAPTESLLPLRYASTINPHNEASETLKALHAAEFQQHLNELRQSTRVLSYPSLLAEFQARLPDTTPEDASSVCEALAASGAILRQGNLVYLRPDEVLDALRRVLPVDEASLRARLAEAEAELEVLQRQRTAIHRSARLRSRVMNYAVLGAMLAQWGLLFRLTYWELSWDVVEPIGFFAGGATSVASCAYFVRTRRDFTYEAMYNSFLSSYEKRAFEDAKFDIQEYNRLQKEVERLKSILEASKDARGTSSGAVDES